MLQHQTKHPDPLAKPISSSLIPSQSVSETVAASTAGKRPADGSSTANPRAAKRPKLDSVSCKLAPDEGTSIQTEGADEEPSEGEDEESSGEDEELSPIQPEPQRQVQPALRICRHLLKMFSVPLLRSHATISLVDRDRLQLYHINRSVILVSSAINFSTGDGKDKLIATIIAFHRLSLDQNGILTSATPKNVGPLPNTDLSGKVRVVQRGNELHFSGNDHEPFKVELTDIISREEGMIGRSTLVLNSTQSLRSGTLP